MAGKDRQIGLESGVQLIFNDACKNISDLKARQWQATTLSIAGIVGIATFSHSSEKPGQVPQMPTCHGQQVLTAFIAGILVGYIFVMWRCNGNLRKFKSRLETLVRDKFPAEEQKYFYKVDEGTIVAVAYFAVGVAFLFATLDIWKQLQG